MMDPNTFSDAQLAGQRLMVGFDGLSLNADLRFLIETLKVAGIILFARNVSAPDQVRRLCADAQTHARRCGQPPLLIAVDQEGGTVARLKAPFTVFPGNPAMKAPADAENFARITATELLSVGINMDLAPVMDVAFDGAESIMAQRAFGSDPAWVAQMGGIVIDGLQRRGVMAVAKHFPGIGRTTLDSHLDLPVLDAPAAVLTATDIKPFADAISRDVAAVMLSHIRYPHLDGIWPASLSVPIARDLLRVQLGYTGVVMTDDLDMGAIQGRYPIRKIMARIDRAHIDLALICHKGPDIPAAFDALQAVIGESAHARRRAKAAAGRVLALKQRYLAPV